ncbi:trypsin-like peptidase domain-containing protein [Micromonospora sp. WMMD980]|uniref:VMAP-C domain-containing protein n=1 Tax=Micromonospora sp. WMMD980 TaxID=3016088 RepID=UPI002415AE0A|nr:trypsin-like peptidase domain-containing protein [Micromonospora sp. WMMD980]MDG4802375.1 trypsin-like peptidase domain-containing protein [Micromonospora sp. WMMD980]
MVATLIADGFEGLGAALRATLLEVPRGPGIRGGTAFFVAPGYALTCAHVVNGREGAELPVRWDGRELTARVVLARPRAPDGQSIWPLPDLAVLHVPDAAADHPCVWLGERLPAADAPLQTFGFAGAYGTPALTSARLSCAGPQGLGSETALRVVGDELPEGLSGSPILDLAVGEVCAVVKTARSPGQPHGGLAVPLRELRRLSVPLLRELWRGHDRYHGVDRAWAHAADRLRDRSAVAVAAEAAALLDPTATLPVLRAVEEAKLRAVLAVLPAADDAHVLYEQACGGPMSAPQPAEPLLDRRDVIRALDDVTRARRGELHPLLVFARALVPHCPPDEQSRLQDWITDLALRLGQRAQLAQVPVQRAVRPDSSVLVEVTPAGHDHQRFLLAVWLFRSRNDVRCIARHDTPMALPELESTLRTELRAGLHELGWGRSILVELALPPELLDLPVDEWVLAPYDVAPLGLVRPVLVRLADDSGFEAGEPEAEERWRELHASPSGVSFATVDCGAQIGPAWFFARITRLNPGGVLLPGPLTDPARRGLLEAGARAGAPVALWSRVHCPRHDDDRADADCRGRAFLTDLEAQLRHRPLGSLPTDVRRLRAAALEADDERHCGHRLVLLWDNPFRRFRDFAALDAQW